MTDLSRDFIGYGRNPPDPKWPNGARLALNFVFNYEEGSERSIGDGDGLSEPAPGFSSPIARGERDLASESMFEYGSRVGFWRLYDMFRERQMTATVFACAQAFERNPEATAAIREAGFDICCHGWRWAQHFIMDEARERAEIARAVESLKASFGEHPAGWYCRYGPSLNTRRLIVENGGFLYDSDSYNDELPYWSRVTGKPHLVIPYTLTHNDTLFTGGDVGTGREFFEFLQEAFDLLYDEGATRPKMMSVGLHMRIAGHPARASGLKRFLDHVQGREGVWICGRADIARHWHTLHPAPDAAA